MRILPTQGNIDNLKLKLPEGTVLIVEPGERGPLMIKNFKDFTLILDGVTINGRRADGTHNPYGVILDNCQGFSIQSGTVDGGSQGIKLVNFTSDGEVKGVEIRNSGFAGIMGKTDPTANILTHRGNFVMKNIMIHDNYIHHTGGEGMYFGHSFYGSTPAPHLIENLQIFNNRVEQVSSDGIQVGCSPNVQIYNNYINGTGINPHKNFQSSGIQIGDGSKAYVNDNIIMNTGSNGISLFGIGGDHIFRNHIINAGTCGIFVDERSGSIHGESYTIEDNDFNGYGEVGVKFFSEHMNNRLIKNRFSNKETYLSLKEGVKVEEFGNIQINYINRVA